MTAAGTPQPYLDLRLVAAPSKGSGLGLVILRSPAISASLCAGFPPANRQSRPCS